MKIGLLDHMGYGNLGDAAIQDAVIANIRKRLPDAILVGFSLIPHDTERRHGVPCYPIRRWHATLESRKSQAVASKGLKSRLKSALKSSAFIYKWAKPVANFVHEMQFWARSYGTLRKLDLLIISGGGQLCELWDGPWSHPYAVFKFSFLAKVARTKLYILNVGAGPLKDPLSQSFAKWAVWLADYRSFRDLDSANLIRTLGVKEEIYVWPDPVYGLDVKDQLNDNRRSSPMPIVGFNPIPFCDPRIWPRKDDSIYQDYLAKITQFSIWLLKQGYFLRIFTTEFSVDQYVMMDLMAQLRLRLASSPGLLCQVLTGASESVKEVLAEMAECDFIVTSKFHGIIFSHLLNKPVISLSYHRKMNAAMEAVRQEEFCGDIEHFSTRWLMKAFSSLVDQSNSIKQQLMKEVEANAAKLSQQFDSLFLLNDPEASNVSRGAMKYGIDNYTCEAEARINE